VRAEGSVDIARALDLYFNFAVAQARCFAPEEMWTLHPWEGTVGKPRLALGEPSLHPIDSVGGGSVRKPVYTCVNAGVRRAGSDGAAQ
jgi:hypothetical protein